MALPLLSDPGQWTTPDRRPCARCNPYKTNPKQHPADRLHTVPLVARNKAAASPPRPMLDGSLDAVKPASPALIRLLRKSAGGTQTFTSMERLWPIVHFGPGGRREWQWIQDSDFGRPKLAVPKLVGSARPYLLNSFRLAAGDTCARLVKVVKQRRWRWESCPC